MKKILAVILLMFSLFLLTGCFGGDDDTTSSDTYKGLVVGSADAVWKNWNLYVYRWVDNKWQEEYRKTNIETATIEVPILLRDGEFIKIVSEKSDTGTMEAVLKANSEELATTEDNLVKVSCTPITTFLSEKIGDIPTDDKYNEAKQELRKLIEVTEKKGNDLVSSTDEVTIIKELVSQTLEKLEEVENTLNKIVKSCFGFDPSTVEEEKQDELRINLFKKVAQVNLEEKTKLIEKVKEAVEEVDVDNSSTIISQVEDHILNDPDLNETLLSSYYVKAKIDKVRVRLEAQYWTYGDYTNTNDILDYDDNDQVVTVFSPTSLKESKIDYDFFKSLAGFSTVFQFPYSVYSNQIFNYWPQATMRFDRELGKIYENNLPNDKEVIMNLCIKVVGKNFSSWPDSTLSKYDRKKEVELYIENLPIKSNILNALAEEDRDYSNIYDLVDSYLKDLTTIVTLKLYEDGTLKKTVSMSAATLWSKLLSSTNIEDFAKNILGDDYLICPMWDANNEKWVNKESLLNIYGEYKTDLDPQINIDEFYVALKMKTSDGNPVDFYVQLPDSRIINLTSNGLDYYKFTAKYILNQKDYISDHYWYKTISPIDNYIDASNSGVDGAFVGTTLADFVNNWDSNDTYLEKSSVIANNSLFSDSSGNDLTVTLKLNNDINSDEFIRMHFWLSMDASLTYSSNTYNYSKSNSILFPYLKIDNLSDAYFIVIDTGKRYKVDDVLTYDSTNKELKINIKKLVEKLNTDSMVFPNYFDETSTSYKLDTDYSKVFSTLDNTSLTGHVDFYIRNGEIHIAKDNEEFLKTDTKLDIKTTTDTYSFNIKLSLNQ